MTSAIDPLNPSIPGFRGNTGPVTTGPVTTCPATAGPATTGRPATTGSQRPSGMPCHRYRPFPAVDLPDRQWPSRTVTTAPRWLSTDLRDGNQALIDPMNAARKQAMFSLLVKMGYKEIEVGFPAASQTEFDFVRSLIETGSVPDDVRISVLTQAREELIERTVQSLAGARQATVHLYNAAAPMFRSVVFGWDGDGRAECTAVAAQGTRAVMKFAETYLGGTDFGYEYSPEIFADTELEFSLEICEAVMDAWRPSAGHEIVLNLYSQGIDPMIDFSDIDQIRRTAEYCNRISVHERHPYAGDLVYTSFSGSHQDAIKKGFDHLERAAARAGKPASQMPWEMPYLPIDPRDVGRSYEAVIRVNSQSGKGGVAYIMKSDHHLDLPRRLQIEFSHVIQRHTEDEGGEVDAAQMWQIFAAEYLGPGTVELVSFASGSDDGTERIRTTIRAHGTEHGLTGVGNGPIAAFCQALSGLDLGPGGASVRVLDYAEHALTAGRDAEAAAYLELQVGERVLWGVGISESIVRASLLAVISALNRATGPAQAVFAGRAGSGRYTGSIEGE